MHVCAPRLRDQPLLDAAQLAVAARGAHLIDVPAVPGVEERARLLAVPAGGAVPGRVVVVGTGLESRDDAVRNLTVLLVIGGPVALLLASVAGYGVASAALRPVEEMRAQAARISGSAPGERLPLGPAGDEVRRLGETLNAMLERVERAVAHERAFVSDASHELRTPLTILKTELELRRTLAGNSAMAIIQRHSTRAAGSRGVFEGDTLRDRLREVQQPRSVTP